MARPGPSYQHIRTYNSGVNGDGQPTPGSINEGELAINLATKRVYTSRREVTYLPPDSELTLADSDHVRAVNQFYAGSPTILRVGAKFRIFSIAGFDSEVNPDLRRYAGISLLAPFNGSDVPARYRWSMNGGVDSDISAHLWGDFYNPNSPLIRFSSPLRLDSDNRTGSPQLNLPGLGKKIEWYLGKNNVLRPGVNPQRFYPDDSEYPNRQGWYVYFDSTPLSVDYPDSGTLYVWNEDTYLNPDGSIAPNPLITREAVITPDSDFIRYCDYTQEDLYAFIQDTTQLRPGTTYPFYGNRSALGADTFFELLVDSTPFLPEFSARVFASMTPVLDGSNKDALARYNIAGQPSAQIIIAGGLQGNNINPFPALQPYMRLRSFTGDDEVIVVNNVPFVGQTPPGYNIVDSDNAQSTGDFWINNFPGDSDLFPTPGKLSWYDDTLRNNAFAQGYARYLANNVAAPGTPDVERRALMLTRYNLVFRGPDNQILNPNTVWYEWRHVASDTNLGSRPELEPYVPDYGLRINPIALGPYEPSSLDIVSGNYLGNPKGIDSDAWTLFINTLEISNARAGQTVRRVRDFNGRPTRVSPEGIFYYITEATAIAVDVFYNGSRLQENIDYQFISGLGVTPLAEWGGGAGFPQINNLDLISIVSYSPVIRETSLFRSIDVFVWGRNATRDSDLIIPTLIGSESDIVDVLVNGVYQVNSVTNPGFGFDYTLGTLSDGRQFIDFNRIPNLDDIITIIAYQPAPVAYQVGRRRNVRFAGPIAAGTVLSVPQGITDSDSIDVQVDGVSLDNNNTAYTWTTSIDPNILTTNVTIINAIPATSRVNIITYGVDKTT